MTSEQISLPGKRSMWWGFGILAVLLPLTLMVSGGTSSTDGELEGLRFQVRMRNVLWRMTQLTPPSRDAGRDTAKRTSREKTTSRDKPDKSASQSIDDSMAGASDERPSSDGVASRERTRPADSAGSAKSTQPADASPDADPDRPALRKTPASTRALPPGQALMAETVVALFDQARTPSGREMVIAHAVAIDADETATRLAARLKAPSAAIRATLAATAPRRGEPAISPLAMAVTPANALVGGADFGGGWGPFIRERVRARVHGLAGDRLRARRANAKLAWSNETLLPLLYTLLQGLMMAGFFGGGIWLVGALRLSAARRQAKADARADSDSRTASAAAGTQTQRRHQQSPQTPPKTPPLSPIAWLRSRHVGLGDEAVYPRDPLVPLLGFGAWLMVYLLAGLIIRMVPGPRDALGLQVLFQALAGGLFAAWVVAAFSRTQVPLDAARLRPAAGGSSPWRASTAALWAYCAVLPPMVAIALVNVVIAELAGLQGAAPHPVVGMLLDNADPLQIGALAAAVALGAPLGEELIFRAFLYRALRRHTSILLSACLSGAVFALVHMSPAAFLPYMTLGVAFALVYEWTGSLWASIVLHGLWNTVVFGCMAVITLS